jgi:hypothetical protein
MQSLSEVTILDIIRPELPRLLEDVDGLSPLLLRTEDVAQVGIRFGIVGLERDGAFEISDGFIGPAVLDQGDTQVLYALAKSGLPFT